MTAKVITLVPNASYIVEFEDCTINCTLVSLENFAVPAAAEGRVYGLSFLMDFSKGTAGKMQIVKLCLTTPENAVIVEIPSVQEIAEFAEADAGLYHGIPASMSEFFASPENTLICHSSKKAKREIERVFGSISVSLVERKFKKKGKKGRKEKAAADTLASVEKLVTLGVLALNSM